MSETNFSEQIKGFIISKEIFVDPLLGSLLNELEKLEKIRNDLYTEVENNDTMELYTNKGGNTNLVINPAVKEYKQYTQRHNETIKTIYMMIKDKIVEKPKEDIDDFMKLLRR